MENLMKKTTVTLSLLAIISTSLLHPMEQYSLFPIEHYPTYYHENDITKNGYMNFEFNDTMPSYLIEQHLPFPENDIANNDYMNFDFNDTMPSFLMKQHSSFPENDTVQTEENNFKRETLKETATQAIEKETGNNYLCTFEGCSKLCQSPNALTMHYRTHTNERPFKCTVCEWSFKQKQHLKDHMERHKKNSQILPPTNCLDNHLQMDGISFAQRNHLTESEHNTNNYMNIETPPHQYFNNTMPSLPMMQYLPFPENNIAKTEKNSFKKQTLKKSTTTQAIGKREGNKFLCNFEGCYTIRSSHSALVIHYRTHTQEKLFKCAACNLLFTQKFNLTKHVRTQHDPTREL